MHAVRDILPARCSDLLHLLAVHRSRCGGNAEEEMQSALRPRLAQRRVSRTGTAAQAGGCCRGAHALLPEAATISTARCRSALPIALKKLFLSAESAVGGSLRVSDAGSAAGASGAAAGAIAASTSSGGNRPYVNRGGGMPARGPSSLVPSLRLYPRSTTALASSVRVTESSLSPGAPRAPTVDGELDA